MINVSIQVTKDTATPAVRALQRGLDPDAVLPIFGRSMTNAVRANFDNLEASRPNKMGGQRTHYYSGARAGTHFVVNGEEVIVGVQQVGIRYRYFGGTIRAGQNQSAVGGKPTKYLTIPATPEAYGHRAAEFDDLTVLWGRDGPYALGRVTQKTVAIADSSGAKTVETEVLFWLVKSVEGSADRTLLPSNDDLQDAVQRDFNKYVRLIWGSRELPGSVADEN